jgi:pyrimidine-specific ribonucleoside hydrolase
MENELIVETDIGHDPDDFFALCYLFSAGVDIRAILLTPGDESQVAIVKFLINELSPNTLIGVPLIGRHREEPTSVHRQLLEKYKYPLHSSECLLSEGLLNDRLHPVTELFICGAVKNIGRYLSTHQVQITKATMQGGFIGYDEHGIKVPQLDKFKGRNTVATFNLNGDVKGSTAFLEANIQERRFVSKNVCHTIVYNTDVHRRVMQTPPRNRASELLREGMGLYLKRHPKGKKFHDPSAAVCHLHPEIATWVNAKLYREKGQWGAHVNGTTNDKIIVDIDYDKLWEHIAESI